MKLRAKFRSKVIPGGPDWNTWDNLYRTVANTDRDQDFTPVFIGHARLYVLGDKYGIDELMSTTLYKLHKTLALFVLYENRVPDVLSLVRYIYKHTRDGSSDRLRALVVEYIASEIKTIKRVAEFDTLFEEGGEFVVDFWRVIQEHL